MSRPYKIQLSKDVVRVVHVEDGVTSPLELLSILDEEQMTSLLEEQLVKEGFEIDGHHARKALDDGLVAEVDMAAKTVSLKVEGEHRIETKAEVDGWGDTDYGRRRDQEEKLMAAEELRVNKAIDKKADELQQQATQKLEGMLRDMQQDIRRITGEVTKEALKVKARSLGSVEEMSEGTDGSMDIKVRL